jgi:hypothetical protein
MITADQLLAHAVGDYLLQSHWMATEKTKRSLAAAAHALTYGLPFLAFRPSWAALAVIVGTHFVIDRWRLARFVVAAKNFLGPVRTWPDSRAVAGTGYDPDLPPWLAVWLLIIADNTLHVLINGLALAYL